MMSAEKGQLRGEAKTLSPVAQLIPGGAEPMREPRRLLLRLLLAPSFDHGCEAHLLACLCLGSPALVLTALFEDGLVSAT